jgi:ribosomal protein S18 acetylase RimI-like enzyme
MSAKCLIRAAHTEDAEAIARIHVFTRQTAFRSIVSDEYLDNLSIEKSVKKWQAELEAQKVSQKIVLLAEIDAEVVGFCMGGPATGGTDALCAEVYSLFVEPEHASEGIGSCLLAALFERLCEQGYTRAYLWVHAANNAARKFYEKSGWSFDGEMQKFQNGKFEFEGMRYVIAL